MIQMQKLLSGLFRRRVSCLCAGHNHLNGRLLQPYGIRQLILSQIADEPKCAIYHIPVLQIFPVETIPNGFLRSIELRHQTLHPSVCTGNITIGSFTAVSPNSKGALKKSTRCQGKVNPVAGKHKRPSCTFPSVFYELLHHFLHIATCPNICQSGYSSSTILLASFLSYQFNIGRWCFQPFL